MKTKNYKNYTPLCWRFSSELLPELLKLDINLVHFQFLLKENHAVIKTKTMHMQQ